MQYPLSRDEQAALARYMSDIKNQMQHLADVITSRYGSESKIGELASRALAASVSLEGEILNVEEHLDSVPHLHSAAAASRAIY